jgi:hypothetical protein
MGPLSPSQPFSLEIRIYTVRALHAFINQVIATIANNSAIENVIKTEFDIFLEDQENRDVDVSNLNQPVATVTKVVLMDLDYAIRLLSDLIQSRFHLGHTEINNELFVESIRLSVSIGRMLIHHNHRSFGEFYSAFGPDAFWAVAGKYRFHADNRLRTLTFIASLLIIMPQAMECEQNSIVKAWLQIVIDPLIVLRSDQWSLFDELFQQMTDGILQNHKLPEIFRGISHVDWGRKDDFFYRRSLRYSLLGKVMENMRTLMIEAVDRRDSAYICTLKSYLSPLPAFMKHCLEASFKYARFNINNHRNVLPPIFPNTRKNAIILLACL